MNRPLQISMEQLKPYICICGSEIFEQVFFIRTVPALLSPTQKEIRQPFPAFRCVHCKTLVEFEPKKPKTISLDS